MSKRSGRLDPFVEKIRSDAEQVLADLAGGRRSLPGVVPARYASSTTFDTERPALDEW